MSLIKIRENTTMNINDWKILAKHLNNEMTDEDIKEIENRADDENMQNLIHQTRISLESIDQHLILKKFDSEKAWKKVDQQISAIPDGYQKPIIRKISRLSFLSRIAAVALLLLTVGAITWISIINSNGEKMIVYSTSPTDISHPTVTLPDGTKVTLNHNTKITCPSQFTAETRNVTISGEAFFDVAHNPSKPFIISTDKAIVRVLGTSFNLSAYQNEMLVDIIVKSGKVQLSKLADYYSSRSNPILLMPGDQGIYNKKTNELFKVTKQKTNALSWMTAELKFENTSLPEVLKTIQSVYAVKISIPDTIILSQKLTAQFEKQNIDYVLNVIGLTLNLKINKVENRVYEITQ